MRTVTFNESEFKLVPVEPTEEQVKACSHNENGGLVTPDYRREIYRAMVNAISQAIPNAGRVAYTDGMGHLHWVNGRKVGVSLYVAPVATVREAHEERPEFEAWLWGDKTERDPDDMNKPEIDAAWRAWQARANLEVGDKDE